MSSRVGMAHSLLRLGAFIQSLSVVVMKPDDLVEFSRQGYSNPGDVESWAEDSLVDSGLNAEELALLAEIPATQGNLLLLGVGGGREAIPLAHMGFQVTGVDFVAAMVDRAKENAFRRGVSIEGLVQEISQLEVPANAFDIVWLSREIYSCVPTRARRVEMLRRIKCALKPGGFLICQFRMDPEFRLTGKGLLIRRLVALCTLGNLAYEPGDTLWLNIEFVHAFDSPEAIRAEIEEGGLSVVKMQTDRSPFRCGAVCKKSLDTN